MRFYKTKNGKQILFSADNVKIEIDGKKYYNKDIISIKVICNLGKFFPVHKHYNKIDMLVDLPPLPEMSGSVTITTIDGEYHFPKVYYVMEAYMFFTRIYDGTVAEYTYRDKVRSYRYKNKMSEAWFEKHNDFAVVFVLDKEKEFDAKAIRKIKDDWSSHCGFRRCMPNENCCFNELALFNDEDKWITTYDDSIESLSVQGALSQSEIYFKESNGHTALLVSVYGGEALLVTYCGEDSQKIFYCGSEEVYNYNLRGKKTEICRDYDILERVAMGDGEIAVKDIFENKNMTMNERLIALANRLGINDYFIRVGFYDVFSMSPFELREFANGYRSESNRIRADEKQLEALYLIMYQGNSSLEVTYADETLELGTPFTVTFHNIGRSKDGLAFCIGNAEIHDIITAGLKSGKVPLRVKDAHFVSIKEEFDKEDIPDGINADLNSEKEIDIFENVPFEMEYQSIRGRYQFVYENDDYTVPSGIIINKDMIKSKEDKKIVDWQLKRYAVTLTFTLESDVPLWQDIQIMAIPYDNTYGGVGRLTVPIGKLRKQ